jgi:RPA family protein
MRPVAYKVRIEDLLNGEYRRSADGSEPSYLLSPWGEHLSRARVMATVVDKYSREDGSYATLTLDDGSGHLRVKAWGRDVARIDSIKVGTLVDVIGRVREFEGEVYLTPDIVLQVSDPNWETVRNLEILKARKKLLAKGVKPKLKPAPEPAELPAEIPEPAVPEVAAEPVAVGVKEKVLAMVGEYPDGVSASEITKKLGVDDREVEEALRELLTEGRIYEAEAGRFKAVV